MNGFESICTMYVCGICLDEIMIICAKWFLHTESTVTPRYINIVQQQQHKSNWTKSIRVETKIGNS